MKLFCMIFVIDKRCELNSKTQWKFRIT